MYRSSIHLVKVPTNPCYYLEFSPQKQKNQAARAGHGEFFDWHFANGARIYLFKPPLAQFSSELGI
jgi:hypothetical protein